MWIISSTNLDLCSLLGKDPFVFLPIAHPLQVKEWLGFKFGDPVTIFSMDGWHENEDVQVFYEKFQ